MKSALLVHWKPSELAERAERLEAAGLAVIAHGDSKTTVTRTLGERMPDVIVIDLERLPSHGREIARWAGQTKRMHGTPIVFVGGDEDKAERAKRDFPAAQHTTWPRIKTAVAKALARKSPAKAAAPTSAGYSGTPLPKKLGLKAGHTLALLKAPDSMTATLGELPADVSVRTQARGSCDVLVLFCRSQRDLKAGLPAARKALAKNGGLWIAWPKKTSPMAGDLSETEVRQIGLESGLVDNKICAIDGDWSGLRFVYRVADR